jgi:hypothetical protein
MQSRAFVSPAILRKGEMRVRKENGRRRMHTASEKDWESMKVLSDFHCEIVKSGSRKRRQVRSQQENNT